VHLHPKYCGGEKRNIADCQAGPLRKSESLNHGMMADASLEYALSTPEVSTEVTT
jgi:hypothetical protein